MTRNYHMGDFRDEMIRRGVTKRPGKATTLAIARYGESELDRVVRVQMTTKRQFYASIVQAAKARLSLLDRKGRLQKLFCPWKRLTDCTAECRCGGTGEVSVGFLIRHYESMIADYARLA